MYTYNVCMYVYIYIYAYVHKYTHTYYIYIYIYTHIYTHNIYIYIYIYMSPGGCPWCPLSAARRCPPGCSGCLGGDRSFLSWEGLRGDVCMTAGGELRLQSPLVARLSAALSVTFRWLSGGGSWTLPSRESCVAACSPRYRRIHSDLLLNPIRAPLRSLCARSALAEQKEMMRGRAMSTLWVGCGRLFRLDLK